VSIPDNVVGLIEATWSDIKADGKPVYTVGQ
jgi:hypothetical protein